MKKGSVQSSPGRRLAAKKEWNTNLTDDDKYKLSKEEMMRRKKLFISKHNILTSSPHALTTGKSRPMRRRVVKSRTVKNKNVADDDEISNSDDLSSTLDDITSLDLLTGDDATNYHDEDSNSINKENSANRDHRQRAVKTSTKQARRPVAKRVSTEPTAIHTPIKINTSNSSRHSPDKVQIENSISPRFESTTQKTKQRGKSQELSITEREMKEIGGMIDMLNGEVSHFEQLIGKKSAIDVEELKMVVGVDGSEGEEWSKKSPVTVMRLLVHLVCQCMSHLLQSEVEKETKKKEFDVLNGKVEHLLSLNSYQKPISSEVPKKAASDEYVHNVSTPRPPLSGDDITTPQTDDTVDLYASTSHRNYDHESCEGVSNNLYSANVSTPFTTPTTGEFSKSSGGGRSTHKVRFRLDSEDPTVESAQDDDVDGVKFVGTATSDWLFNSASTLATTEKFSDSATSLSFSSSSSVPTTPSDFHMAPPKPPLSNISPNSRVQELQRQLAMIREKPGNNSNPTRYPSITSRSGEIKVTMNEGVGPKESEASFVMSVPQEKSSNIRIPAVRFTRSSNRNIDSSAASSGSTLGELSLTNNANDKISRDEKSNDHDSDPDGIGELSSTHMSLSAIPSHFLPPAPERQPTHPYLLHPHGDERLDILVERATSLHSGQQNNPNMSVYDSGVNTVGQF